MSQPRSNCPQCGAPIQFRFSSAVQTVCEFCKSILVRSEIDLKKVGTVADLPPEVSPIQLRTEGIYQGKAFWVAGRILYKYEFGGWNEWHLVFQDGRSGWLSDAQAQYAVTFPVQPEAPLPAKSDLKPEVRLVHSSIEFRVTTLTRAQYVGVEGELPFEYWDKETVLFADLRSGGNRFATIDYSEDPPLLFIGEAVEFDELKLKNLREFEGW